MSKRLSSSGLRSSRCCWRCVLPLVVIILGIWGYLYMGATFSQRSINELQDGERIGSQTTTVVSCYYRVASKYHFAVYDGWIENFMAMRFRSVIYSDSDGIAYLTDRWPANDNRIYIEKSIAQFHTSKWDWAIDETLDPEQCVNHNRRLYQIWNEKIFLVNETVHLNPFHTETFAWVDIGCFRTTQLSYFRGFPDARKVNVEKVTFLQIEKFRPHEKVRVAHLDHRFARVDRIGGGMFMGNGTALRRFAALHDAIITEAKQPPRPVFAGKDQSLFAFNILRHPDLFDTVSPTSPSVAGLRLGKSFTHDRWMMLQLLWASATPTRPVSHPPTPTCEVYFLILSTLGARSRRDAIRRSWLAELSTVKPRPLTYRYHFVVGHPTDARGRTRAFTRTWDQLLSSDEWTAHDDLLLLPFIDSYWNLTVKVGVMFKWPEVLNSGCRLLVKVDDDVYLRSRRFTTIVRSLPPAPAPLYGGWYYDQINVTSEVSRDPHNRHSMTTDEFPHKYFEPYAGGPVYYMTTEVAAALPYDLVEVVKSVDDVEMVPSTYLSDRAKALYKLEDAYMGHLVRRIPITHSDGGVGSSTSSGTNSKGSSGIGAESASENRASVGSSSGSGSSSSGSSGSGSGSSSSSDSKRLPLQRAVQCIHTPHFFAHTSHSKELQREAAIIHGITGDDQLRRGRFLFT